DVLKERLSSEYNLPIEFDTPRFQVCRWVSANAEADLYAFTARHHADMAEDLDGALVFMAPSIFELRYEMQRASAIVFSDVKDHQRHPVSQYRGRHPTSWRRRYCFSKTLG